jgi:hypothetical protein
MKIIRDTNKIRHPDPFFKSIIQNTGYEIMISDHCVFIHSNLRDIVPPKTSCGQRVKKLCILITQGNPPGCAVLLPESALGFQQK